MTWKSKSHHGIFFERIGFWRSCVVNIWWGFGNWGFCSCTVYFSFRVMNSSAVASTVKECQPRFSLEKLVTVIHLLKEQLTGCCSSAENCPQQREQQPWKLSRMHNCDVYKRQKGRVPWHNSSWQGMISRRKWHAGRDILVYCIPQKSETSHWSFSPNGF